jgi:Skp family chaperone for outer membrane proteins
MDEEKVIKFVIENMKDKFGKRLSQMEEENKTLKTEVEHLKAKVNILAFEFERLKRPKGEDSVRYWSKRVSESREGSEREFAQEMLALAMYEMEHEG